MIVIRRLLLLWCRFAEAALVCKIFKITVICFPFCHGIEKGVFYDGTID